ncbi:MAG: hypothetical protein RLN90_09550 [Balneolaceae bacterium]
MTTIRRTLRPKAIYLADHESVVDGTIDSIADLKAHASKYLVPSRTETDAILHLSAEDVDFVEQGSTSGLQVLADRLRKAMGAGFSINMGRWEVQIQALSRGQSNVDDVETDQTTSIAADNDATGMTGLKAISTLTKTKFVALMELPVNLGDGKTLYILFQKVVAASNEGDIPLNNSQVSQTLRFDSTLLEAAEVTAYQAIHAEVVDDGLYYIIEGKTDV